MRKRVAAALAVCALSVGAGADVAAAQPEQNGLVNVFISDVLNNNEVGIGVAANVGANVCVGNVQVGVIANQVARTGGFTCQNDQGAEVRIEQ